MGYYTPMKEPLDPIISYRRGSEQRANPPSVYVPDGALQISLDEYAGPLDILLYLIRKQQLPIEDINIADIAEQYADYLKLMRQFNLQLAAEYLVMSAILAEIKSSTLLPQLEAEGEDAQGESMRAALIRRLREYESLRNAAERLERSPRLGRDFWPVQIRSSRVRTTKPVEIFPDDLRAALAGVFAQQKIRRRYELHREEFSMQDRMVTILERLRQTRELRENNGFISFQSFLSASEGAAGVAITFIAMLQLIKEQRIEVKQENIFQSIYIRIYEVPQSV